LAGPAAAYETDQLTHRSVDLRDSAPALDREVNRALDEVLARQRPGADESAIVDAIFHRIGGYHWVDRLERWAMRSPEVEKLPTPRWRSFYRDLPLHASRVSGLFGIGPSFRVGDTLIGSDKIGHFLSQGRKYWRRWRRSGDEARAAEQSAFTERAIFGKLTTGGYSNADLVANYEGHRFYRSLFEDDIVPGKPAILRRVDGRWQRQRDFSWTDYVNPYWDESINVNGYDGLIRPHVARRWRQYCEDYRVAPQRYDIDADTDARLAQRYGFLQLQPANELRLAVLCADTTAGTGAAVESASPAE
jgi:hypothetical protein